MYEKMRLNAPAFQKRNHSQQRQLGPPGNPTQRQNQQGLKGINSRRNVFQHTLQKTKCNQRVVEGVTFRKTAAIQMSTTRRRQEGSRYRTATTPKEDNVVPVAFAVFTSANTREILH